MSRFHFLITDRKFSNFNSFCNHARNYSKKNNLDFELTLKENYDKVTNCKDKFCKHCGKECDYKGYNIGYVGCCYSPLCYKKFINSNVKYYINQKSRSFFDLYDETQYQCSFSKRYFDITQELIASNNNFDIKINCIVCNKFIHKTSAFNRDRNKKTCSTKCKHKQIGFKVRKKSLSCNSLDTFSDKLEDRIKLNHYIYKHRKYPSSKVFETNKEIKLKYEKYPELKLPNASSRVHYSEQFNMYFYSNGDIKNNSLYHYLGNSLENYLRYHIKNKLGKTSCPNCNKILFFKDVFGKKFIDRVFCTKECYYSSLIGKRHSEETKECQSKKIKMLISQGEFTPNITNSWSNSRTKVIINGKERNVRSSWEALFWILNPECKYEKIRIPYVSSENKNKIYITDFYCDNTSTVYEIKPNSEKKSENNIIKTKYALEYCKQNDLNYKIIDENYFNEKLKKSDLNYIFSCMEDKSIKNIKKSFKGSFETVPTLPDLGEVDAILMK